MAPQLWDSVRYFVDKTDGYGLYILTGSTIVDNSKIKHNGAGRIHRLVMSRWVYMKVVIPMGKFH